MLAPGTIIDSRYEIVGPLGGGGMGQVYRARRTLLGDEVALKVMNAATDAMDAQSELRQRFLRESRACAQLRHPHIVTLHDFNVDSSGQPYLVMELLSGPSLREELELQGPMSAAAALAILRPIAAALQVAHERGITHRDLKPANIVAHRYESGERVYKVIDFGIAAIEEASDVTRLTAPNMFVGTLAYAAPEQLNGEPADPRTDVYSLGVIAYEMLAGQRPFEASAGLTIIQQTLSETPRPPGSHRKELSSDIDRVIMRALEKSPEKRWPSASEFVRELERAVGQQPAARTVTPDTLLSRYELGEPLGRGRFGSLVYRGSHRALGVPVAIRVLRREDQHNWDAVRDRFLLEARTLQVPHANLLQVRDFGEDDRRIFVISDYVDGPSLRQELARVERFGWLRAKQLLLQMLDATIALNARGGFIVGVNPDMIRLTGSGNDERVVMSTAGIGSAQDVLATLREQELRGEEANDQELPFVCAEVLLGRAPTPAADVFTLGALGYQMITGTLPFRAPSMLELIGQMLHTRPVAPRSLDADVPEAASDAILAALSGAADKRVQTAAEFRASLFA